jgi:hypothetical protein
MSPKTHGSAVKIERLRLTLIGLDNDAATEFARLVAENLVPGLTAAASGGVELFGGDLTVAIQQPAMADHDATCTPQQVATEVVAALFAQAAPLTGEL